MPHIASIAGPVRRFVVEAYQNIDTGGPEAMVQLALALDSLCPNATYLSKRPLNPRLTSEYPALLHLPQLAHDDLARGDLYLIPETCACDEQMVKRGVRALNAGAPWLTRSSGRPRVPRVAARPPAPLPISKSWSCTVARERWSRRP